MPVPYEHASSLTHMLRPKDHRIRNDIRYYRHRADLKLYELAHLVGASSPANVAHWENGRKVPNLDSLLQLSAALKVPVQYLFLDRWKQMQQRVRERETIPAKKPL